MSQAVAEIHPVVRELAIQPTDRIFDWLVGIPGSVGPNLTVMRVYGSRHLGSGVCAVGLATTDSTEAYPKNVGRGIRFAHDFCRLIELDGFNCDVLEAGLEDPTGWPTSSMLFTMASPSELQVEVVNRQTFYCPPKRSTISWEREIYILDSKLPLDKMARLHMSLLRAGKLRIVKLTHANTWGKLRLEDAGKQLREANFSPCSVADNSVTLWFQVT